MARTSDNLNLIIPEQADYYDVGVHETNYEIIDEEFGKNSTNLVNLQQQVTTHLEDFDPHAEITNRTIYVGNNGEFETLQSAVNTIKKNLGGKSITIILNDGTHEGVTLNGFHNGNIYLNGNTSDVVVGKITILNCTGFFEIKGLKIESNTEAIISQRSLRVKVENCSIVSNGTIGIRVDSGAGEILRCEISNKSQSAIYTLLGGTVRSDSNTGANNLRGLEARSAIIFKNGTQPTGTTGEALFDGGIIQ